jgi:hypothetical protein
MGDEPLTVKKPYARAAAAAAPVDENLWQREADQGIRGPSYLPASAEAAGYSYISHFGVQNKQGQDVGTYDYFMAHLKEFQQTSQKSGGGDDVGKKIDESNKHLQGINDTLGKALTAGGGT